jgi:hypothetical protein
MDIIIDVYPGGITKIVVEGAVGAECEHDLLLQKIKSLGTISEHGFTEDHGKPQPVVYAQRVGVSR